VDIRWRDGRLLGALITADRDTSMRVRYGDVVAAEVHRGRTALDRAKGLMLADL